MADGESDGDRVPWPVAVSFLIKPLGDAFTLPEVYALADPLRRAFPDNRHVEAKIRQSLQILRDREQIAFEGHGRYRKVTEQFVPSVKLDFRGAARFVSRAQVARVAIESWVALNVPCQRCRSPLIPLPANTKLLDVVCHERNHELQIKGVAGIFGQSIVAAAHGPIAARLAEGALPDYLVVSYDRLRELVLMAEFFDGRSIRSERVKARKALGPTARRAGWVGATIDLGGLARSLVVGPSFEPEVTHLGSDHS